MDRLTGAERHELDQLEAQIELYRVQYLKVAEALARVRDGRLYREGYSSFEVYCQERWGFGRKRAHQLIAAAETCLPVVDSGLPAPPNERVARELAGVPAGRRADVWRAALDVSGEPSAADVAAAVGRLNGLCLEPTRAEAELARVEARERQVLSADRLDARARALAAIKRGVRKVRKDMGRLDGGEQEELEAWLAAAPNWLLE